jgi:hypothetical protein
VLVWRVRNAKPSPYLIQDQGLLERAALREGLLLLLYDGQKHFAEIGGCGASHDGRRLSNK